jgi:hypothetical protein
MGEEAAFSVTDVPPGPAPVRPNPRIAPGIPPTAAAGADKGETATEEWVVPMKSVPEHHRGMRGREAHSAHTAAAEAETGMTHSAAATAHSSPAMAAAAVPAATTAARNRHV